MFNVGDKVICIDDQDTFGLEVGNIYTVKGVSVDRVMFKETYNAQFFFRRFRLVPSKSSSPFIEWEKATGVNENCFT
jgi:hypothetical protein